MKPKRMMLIAASISLGFAQTVTFNFEADAVSKPPSGFICFGGLDDTNQVGVRQCSRFF